MLLSACIIAKDEEALLADCVSSVAPLADEVVVYDTGSSDATRLVAAEAGARVIEGSWTASFADARNAALERCAGDWVLSIDADERLRCEDPTSARSALEGVPEELDGLQISIDNLTGDGTGSGYSHVADRLFRRRRCVWKGRVHEQLVSRDSGELARVAGFSGLRLLHLGYLEAHLRANQKLERNLDLARAEAADPSFGDRGVALVRLGRALWAAGRCEESLGPLLEGASATSNPSARRLGLESAARVLLQLGRLDEATSAVEELREASSKSVTCDVLRAGIHLAAGRPGAAVALLECHPGTTKDDDGYEYSERSFANWHSAALVASGRAGEAADLMLGLVDTGLDFDVGLLVDALHKAGRELSEIGRLAPSRLIPALTAAAVRLPSPQAHALLEGLWEPARDTAGPGPSEAEITVLAGAALAAQAMDTPESSTWSSRLRAVGLADLCPLRALTNNTSAPPTRRVSAALAAIEAFDDQTCRSGLLQAAVGLAPRDVEHFGERLRSLLPPAARTDAAADAAVTATLPAHDRTGPSLASVILYAAGGAEEVSDCLQAMADTLPSDIPFEVIVVDPGSTDATSALLGGLSGDVEVVRTPGAVSRARAFNLAAGIAKGDVVVLVDSTARPHRGWLEPLLDAVHDHPESGLCGPAVRDGTGDGHSVGARIFISTPPPKVWAGLPRAPWKEAGEPQIVVEWNRGDPGRSSGPRHVDGLADLLVVLSADALSAAGGLDESYWNGGEILDLCMRVRGKGLSVVVEPASLVESSLPDGPTPWGGSDPDTLSFGAAIGPRWQVDDNRRWFWHCWADQLPSLNGK